MTQGFSVLRPVRVAEALALAGEGGRFVAGGTALQLEWADRAPPATLIDLSAVCDDTVSLTADGRIRIGTLARLADLEANSLIADGLPLLAAAIRDVAAPSVRNLATLGGNVARRVGCLLPALLALDAVVEVHGPNCAASLALRTVLDAPYDPATLLLAVVVAQQAARNRFTHRKIGYRAAFTPSVIGVAGILSLDADGAISTARFAVGGGANLPQRLPATERMVVGMTPEAIDRQRLCTALAEEIDAAEDVFRSARYRRRVAANALVRGLFPEMRAQAAVPKFVPATETAPDEVEVSHAAMPERWHPRPDVADKVAGRFRYLTDHRAPDMLVGRILRAGIPHALIRSIDASAAEALPGVVAVVTAADIPGLNGYGIIVQDMPALCADKVRYVGDAVAAVAAVDAETAGKALALISVEYEPLPVVDDMEKALAPGAPDVHAGGNLQREIESERGDVDAAWTTCAHIVEDVYVTPRQMHGFMETEGGYAIPEADGSITVCAGGQYGRRDRMQLARILAMPEERIRVVTSPTGGGFGGKDELTVQPALALLALKARQPVRLQLSRAESVAAGWKRNPMRIRMKTGCDASGRLIAQEVDLLSDTGAYASLSPGVLETALEHATGPYVIPNVRSHGRLAYTNNGVCGAFRGFGANQMTYAVETQIARLAEMAGLDPIAMRRLNLRPPGSPGPLGQAVAPSERLVEMLDAAAASPMWRAPRGLVGDEVIGVGLALNHQGNGLGSFHPDPGACVLSLTPEGRIAAAFGMDEMGQGIVAAAPAAVAEVLGCARADLDTVLGDTDRTPDSGSTTAARGIHVVWRAAALAGKPFGEKLRAAAGRVLGRDPAELAVAPGGLREARSNDLILTFADLAARLDPVDLPSADCAFEFPKTVHDNGNARFIFAFGAALARVAVDRVTGAVRVLDFEQHTAAGPIVDAAAYLGQIEGGGVQGIGFTLTEDAVMRGGRYATSNFDLYMMPGIADAPRRMGVFAHEELDPHDEHGPRGVGEIGIGAVTPAIAAAIADALGVWPVVTPIAPEAMLDAVEGLR